MKQNLELKLQHKLNLTLSLKHQLNIMVMPKQELLQEIIHELEENPFLEEEIHINNDYQEKLTDLSVSYTEDEEELNPLNRLTYKPSLLKTLEFQIDLEFDGEEKEIALDIIDNLEEKGYISQDSLNEIASKYNVDIETVEKIRKKLMKLEPTGLGAKSLTEFLITEYREKFGRDSIAEQMIQEDLNKIKDKEYLLKLKKYQIDEEALEEIVSNIKALRPYPLYGYEDFEAHYVEPDIFIYETNDKDHPFEIVINEQDLPKLNLTNQYKKILNRKDINEETKKFLYEKLQKAIGLIRGIEQRRENLRKLVETLVEHQKDFLIYGKEHLKPLTLKDVSQKIGLHESTISRIVSNKFAQTPIGVLPLKAFFSNKVSKESGNISSDRVKYLIQNLIENEDPKKPLSDNEIVNLLKKEGIHVARRTVAKYREELNIPDSRKRKKGGQPACK
jgi:RNA polymerase sigma-54 factor